MATRKLADTARSSRSYEPSIYQCALFVSNSKPMDTLNDESPGVNGANASSRDEFPLIVRSKL